VVEQERGQPVEVARVERGAELVERAGRRRARHVRIGLGELAAAAVQRRLDRPDGGRQDLRDLVEAEVEGVLEHDGRALLRG
jgi:hypothetical protein